MTQRQFKEMTGFTGEPVKGTTGCYLIDNRLFVIKQAEIVKGSKFFYALNGTNEVKMTYNVEDDFFILENN